MPKGKAWQRIWVTWRDSMTWTGSRPFWKPSITNDETGTVLLSRPHQGSLIIGVIQKGKGILKMNQDPLLYMVARTLDSSNHGIVWDKSHISCGRRRNRRFIRIGR